MPHLNRTDRDCGSLPFFGKDYFSHKTNKDHLLLAIISKVVQDYWRFASAIADELNEADTKTFMAHVQLLEAIAKNGYDKYQVYGKFPKFTLMSTKQIDKLEAIDAVKQDQIDDDHQQEKEQEVARSVDAVTAKNLMNAELGSDDSTSDASNSTDAAETEGVKNEDDTTQPTESSEELSSAVADKGQLTEAEADACTEDCDSCDNAACQMNQTDDAPDDDAPDAEPNEAKVTDDAPEREDNIGGAVVGGEPCCLDCEMEDQRKTEEADGSEETDLDSDAADEENSGQQRYLDAAEEANSGTTDGAKEEQKSLPAPPPAPPEKKTD
jgi:hypothetical protein